MIIQIKVYPRAKINKIKQISANKFEIHIAAPPEKNRANQAVIELLSQELNISKSKLSIIQGEKSRHKIIEINH